MGCDKLPDITVYIDESGTIAKGKIDKKDFFIISLLITDNTKFVKQIYRKERLRIAKKHKILMDELMATGEIKGSNMSENLKLPIYQKLMEKCQSNFEFGIISLDNSKSSEHFREVSSRAFNYLIKLYLQSFFKTSSKFKCCNSIHFIIDERNVATCSRSTLQEYLNTELNLLEPFCSGEITVEYKDSKNHLLLQMTDFISNTYFRFLEKNIKESEICITALNPNMCEKRLFKFPLH